MADRSHIRVLEQGVPVWNEWRHLRLGKAPDFAEFDFSTLSSLEDPYDAYLDGIDLRCANLTGANLSNVLLTCARLDEANLTNAKLKGADLKGASLVSSRLELADAAYADLRNCALARADLTGARLEGALLHGASLHGARLDATLFADVDLSQTRGLHQAHFVRVPTLDEGTVSRTRTGFARYPYLRLDIEAFFSRCAMHSVPWSPT